MTTSTLSVGDSHDLGPATAGNEVIECLVAELDDCLRRARVDDSAREANEILARLVDMPRWWPAIHASDTVDVGVVRAARRAAHLRGLGAPMAYAVGRAAFRHLTLDVDERVLIPRPETELLVDLVLDSVGRTTQGIVIDVGTGSGALALALAFEGTFDRVIGTDISADAIAVARRNARHLPATASSRVEFRHGCWLAPVRDLRVCAVVCNPPYVAYGEAETLDSGVHAWEPPVALFTGDDGLAATAEVVRESAEVLAAGGLLALEVDSRRAQRAAALVTADGRYCNAVVHQDLTGRGRFVTAWRSADARRQGD
jgi:release factor glutamine methyltransferase